MKKLFLLTLLVLSFLHSASFDCKKASTNIEKTICGAPSGAEFLIGLDERLSNKYNMIKEALPENKKNSFISSQRKWLRERNKNCETHYDISNCLMPMYKKRIEFFETKYKNILFDFPSNSELMTICNNFAENPKLFIKEHSFKSKDFDINNDGLNEKVEVTSQGSAGIHVAHCEYTLHNGETVEAMPIGFEWKDYWANGLVHLNINNKSFRLNTFDFNLEEPAYLSYINQSNEEHVVCEFETKKVEIMTPNSDINNSKEICSLVDIKTEITGEPPTNYPSVLGIGKLKRIELAKNSELNSTYFERTYTNSWSLYNNKEESFDYNNDGKEETIIQIEHSSTKGRMCDVIHFDEVVLDKTSSRKILLKIQELDLKDSYPSCYSHSGFFKYKDQIYYEEIKDDKHNVLQIKNNKISTICEGSFESVTSVKNIKDR